MPKPLPVGDHFEAVRPLSDSGTTGPFECGQERVIMEQIEGLTD